MIAWGMLHLYNTLTKRIEAFQPIQPDKAGMYCCGPTVYNPATIGNLRSYVCEDILKRTLQFLGYEVTHVMNITDVGHLTDNADAGEDKIEREASRAGKSAWDIAKEYEARFFQDLSRLNVIKPTYAPRATANIPEQIALIHDLDNKGFTYRTSDGIYFDTSKFKEYGKLSGQRLEDKEAGARVEVNEEKKHPTDFALWKFSPNDQKRQMEWESPWGMGFPGWHIECSAMSVKYLGQPFDIHCGGIDHIPVHHENEIAQSEAAYGRPLATYWVHNEFLTIDGRRMGKSEGNAYTLDDVVNKGFDPLALRYFYLTAHYRTKLNFTWEALEAAQITVEKIFQALSQLVGDGSADEEAMTAFRSALEEDVNMPKALAVVWEVIRSDRPAGVKRATLLAMDEVLGLGLATRAEKNIVAPEEVVQLADQRQDARRTKDWARADALRQEIENAGWTVKDTADGYTLLSSRAYKV